MTLRAIGAGLGRTGTMSLKLGLEKLLGGPCYHMLEVFPRPDHVAMWHGAVRGTMPDWDELFEGFVAAVDWPVCTFWRQLAEKYPDAPIILSVRDADSWWTSADRTIFEATLRRFPGDQNDPWLLMVKDLFSLTFTPNVLDEAEAKAAFERHNDEVRRTAPPDRLVEWQIGAGWEPLCEALGLSVPDEPFPHANTTKEFRGRAGWD
jgi:hypothetical protein